MSTCGYVCPHCGGVGLDPDTLLTCYWCSKDEVGQPDSPTDVSNTPPEHATSHARPTKGGRGQHEKKSRTIVK